MKRASLWACGVVVALGLIPAAAGAATITPTIATDELNADADCSLREAVQAANINDPVSGCPEGDLAPTTDTIVLPAGPYILGLGGNADDDNDEGDLDVGGGGPTIIAGQNNAVVDADALPDRAFDLQGGNLTLRNMTVKKGDVSSEVFGPNPGRGGNIRAQNAGSLTLENVIVSDGKALDGGGGIYANSSLTGGLTINDSRILGNTDRNNGGGMFLQSPASVRINRTTIDGNSVVDTSNANLKGGGIRGSADDGGELLISDSTISNNFVHQLDNAGASQAYGGGLSISGGGIVRRSLIRGNNVEANGQQEDGGGIHFDNGQPNEPLTVINSTINANRAGNVAAPNQDGRGGGIWVSGQTDSNLVLTHLTFVANTATEAGEADDLQTAVGYVRNVSTRASLFANLILNACEGPGFAPAGSNLYAVSDPDCGFLLGSDAINPALGLAAGPPTDNGGSTGTIGLMAGSPAIDFVPAAQCQAEAQDQRGFFRPSGAGCDAGAYERVTCNGIVQEGPNAVDCPPPPPPPVIPGLALKPAPCANLKGKARKRCLCKQKKSKKKRKKCLKRLKSRKRG